MESTLGARSSLPLFVGEVTPDFTIPSQRCFQDNCNIPSPAGLPRGLRQVGFAWCSSNIVQEPSRGRPCKVLKSVSSHLALLYGSFGLSPHPDTERKPNNPAENAHFHQTHLHPYPFSDSPQLMTICEDNRHIALPGNGQINLQTAASPPITGTVDLNITADPVLPSPTIPVPLSFLSLMNKIPTYFKVAHYLLSVN